MDDELSEFEAEFGPRCGAECPLNPLILCNAPDNHFGAHSRFDIYGLLALWPNTKRKRD